MDIGDCLARIGLDARPRADRADAGLGDGPLEAYAIAEREFHAAGRNYRLEQLAGGWWRMHNRSGAMPPDFDFHTECANEAAMAAQCAALQSESNSIFVQNLIIQRFTPAGEYLRLLGRTLRTTLADGTFEERLVSSAHELAEVVAITFGIAGLWPRVAARHAELFPPSA